MLYPFQTPGGGGDVARWLWKDERLGCSTRTKNFDPQSIYASRTPPPPRAAPAFASRLHYGMHLRPNPRMPIEVRLPVFFFLAALRPTLSSQLLDHFTHLKQRIHNKSMSTLVCVLCVGGGGGGRGSGGFDEHIVLSLVRCNKIESKRQKVKILS